MNPLTEYRVDPPGIVDLLSDLFLNVVLLQLPAGEEGEAVPAGHSAEEGVESGLALFAGHAVPHYVENHPQERDLLFVLTFPPELVVVRHDNGNEHVQQGNFEYQLSINVIIVTIITMKTTKKRADMVGST